MPEFWICYLVVAYLCGLVFVGYAAGTLRAGERVPAVFLALLVELVAFPGLLPIVAATLTYRLGRWGRSPAGRLRLRNAVHNIVLHPVAGTCWLLGFKAWGDRVHGEEQLGPWIVTFAHLDGSVAVPATTPQVPGAEYLHRVGGRPVAATVVARSAEEAYQKALGLLVAA